MKKMVFNDILENIKVKKTCLGKSKMTSGNKFRVTLTYKGKTCWFIFNDNYLNKSNKLDFLKSLQMDADAYGWSINFDEFMWEYGYKSPKEALKAFNACKKQYKRYNKLFDIEEQVLIGNYEY